MKQLNIFLATLVLTCFAFFPGVTLADDAMEDLDVTMIVVDDSGDLDDAISEMRGPDDDGVDEDEQREEEEEEEREMIAVRTKPTAVMTNVATKKTKTTLSMRKKRKTTSTVTKRKKSTKTSSKMTTTSKTATK